MVTSKNKGEDILVITSYKLLNQDEETDKMYYWYLGEISRSPALVHVGISISMMLAGNTSERKQSQAILERVESGFLRQMVREPARGGALLDLLFTEKNLWVM